MADVDVPVLVVGAGPVGLCASLLLARLGIRSLGLDRRDGPHRAPQAHVFWDTHVDWVCIDDELPKKPAPGAAPA